MYSGFIETYCKLGGGSSWNFLKKNQVEAAAKTMTSNPAITAIETMAHTLIDPGKKKMREFVEKDAG